jgi:hypothetical protein
MAVTGTAIFIGIFEYLLVCQNIRAFRALLLANRIGVPAQIDSCGTFDQTAFVCLGERQ